MSFALSSSIAPRATFTAPAHTYIGAAFDTLRTLDARPALDARPTLAQRASALGFAEPRAAVGFGRRA